MVEYNKMNKKNNENNTQRDYINLKKLHWIQNLSPKIKRGFTKIVKDIAFTAKRFEISPKTHATATQFNDSSFIVYKLPRSWVVEELRFSGERSLYMDT